MTMLHQLDNDLLSNNMYMYQWLNLHYNLLYTINIIELVYKTYINYLIYIIKMDVRGHVEGYYHSHSYVTLYSKKVKRELLQRTYPR